MLSKYSKNFTINSKNTFLSRRHWLRSRLNKKERVKQLLVIFLIAFSAFLIHFPRYPGMMSKAYLAMQRHLTLDVQLTLDYETQSRTVSMKTNVNTASLLCQNTKGIKNNVLYVITKRILTSSSLKIFVNPGFVERSVDESWFFRDLWFFSLFGCWSQGHVLSIERQCQYFITHVKRKIREFR